MFSLIKITNAKNKYTYDIRSPLLEMSKIIKEHNLQFKYIEKVYFLNNVVITINERGRFFKYENDINIHIKDGYIIREYEEIDCPSFSFHNSDSEEEYRLYEDNDGCIRVKEYEEYYTFEIISTNGLRI